MAQSARKDRQLQAQAAVKSAMEGRLPQVDTYALQLSGGCYSITVPPSAPRNSPAEKGGELPAFVDYQRGFLVYDLGSLGGDSDGDE